jgi:hypothetical protein
MIHAFLPFFRWADHTAVAVWIRDSTWVFALLEVFHLFGLTLLLGTLVVVNLRLFGWGLAGHPLSEVASDALPFTIGGMIATIASGSLLFVSEALKCYGSEPFFIKMGLLFTGLLFFFTFQQRLTKAEQPSGAAKYAAILALVMWFGVGLAGRAIAFF